MSQPEQLEMWTTRETVCELCVDALVRGDEELRAMASALITLIRYHDARSAARSVTPR